MPDVADGFCILHMKRVMKYELKRNETLRRQFQQRRTMARRSVVLTQYALCSVAGATTMHHFCVGINSGDASAKTTAHAKTRVV